jgi:hypothetical protein
LVYAPGRAAQAGLTEGAERSSRLRHETDVEGEEISRQAAPRTGGTVLSEPDFVLAGAHENDPSCLGKQKVIEMGAPVGSMLLGVIVVLSHAMKGDGLRAGLGLRQYFVRVISFSPSQQLRLLLACGASILRDKGHLVRGVCQGDAAALAVCRRKPDHLNLWLFDREYSPAILLVRWRE